MENRGKYNEKKERIGYLGLGSMGFPICYGLYKSGYTMVLPLYRKESSQKKGFSDLAPDPETKTRLFDEMLANGAVGAVDQAELIAASDVMVLSLPTSTQVEEVVLGPDGILEKGKAGMLVIDLTSGDPEISRKLAGELKKKEIHFIDSPMSGGVQKAAAQTLTLMVGGDKEAFEKNREIFDTIGDPEHVYYLGPSGAGDTLKCANNFLSACCAVATTEALAVAAKAGIDPKMAVEVIDSSGGRSHATAYKYPKLMFPDKPWNFTVDLMRKDINLFNESAKTLKVPAFLSGTLYQLWSVPSAQGKGNEDCLNVFKMYEDWCGVKLCGIHEKE